MKTAVHRVKQLWRACSAEVEPREIAELSEYLNPEQRALFARMSVGDRRHCLDLFYALRERMGVDEPLLQAALLHDVGKSEALIHIWQRVAYVLLGKLSVRLRAKLCASARRGWRYPFFVLAHHAGLGADLARQAGCSDEVVALIGSHQRPLNPVLPIPAQGSLLALQAADDD
jgi:putative nucleotidyltransferase with HDIG domain